MDIKPYEPGEFCKTIGCPDFGKIEICSSCCLLYQFHSYLRDHNQILESGSNIEKMVQEAERLRKELADGDYWMQRAEEFSENGGCPLCFGTDEEGHKDGCEVMLLETVNAGLIEASIKSDWDWQAIVDKLKFEISALKSQISNISPDRLQEICEAEAEGRVIVLPCKVGTPVFIINCDSVDCNYCERDGGHGNCPFITKPICPLGIIQRVSYGYSHINKPIFFDFNAAVVYKEKYCEQAEAALKEETL